MQAAYAPVSTWDAVLPTTNPDQLGPDAVGLNCDMLNVGQQLVPLKDRRTIELEALGNARAEGAKYTARGNRITYDQSKEQLILEGDGLSYAELWQEVQPGAERQHTTARTFFYWIKTNRVKVDGPQSLQIVPPGNAK